METSPRALRDGDVSMSRARARARACSRARVGGDPWCGDDMEAVAELEGGAVSAWSIKSSH